MCRELKGKQINKSPFVYLAISVVGKNIYILGDGLFFGGLIYFCEWDLVTAKHDYSSEVTVVGSDCCTRLLGKNASFTHI